MYEIEVNNKSCIILLDSVASVDFSRKDKTIIVFFDNKDYKTIEFDCMEEFEKHKKWITQKIYKNYK